jgi:hypothetical protein
LIYVIFLMVDVALSGLGERRVWLPSQGAALREKIAPQTPNPER